MKQYYIIELGVKNGPFYIFELQIKGISFDADIWSETDKDWLPAKFIPELKPFLVNKPEEDEDKYFGYRLATLWERFLGDLFHGIATLFLYGLYLMPAIMYLGPYIEEHKSTNSGIIILASLAAIYLVISGIGALITIRFIFYPRFSGNFGHILVGLKVINADDGTDCKKLSRCFIREFIKLLIGYSGIFNAWLAFDKNYQNLYDKAANTYVVKKIKYDETE